MKNTIKLLMLAFVIISGFTFALAPSTWKVDPDYSIKFEGRQAEGSFSGLQGLIQYDPADLSNSKFDVSVEVGTINTGNETKDSHAKGESWFDMQNHPKITFKSTSFSKESGQQVVNGILTLRGVPKPVTIPYTFAPGAGGGTFTGTFTVNRKDFGINGSMMGFMVGNEIEISLNIPVSN